MINITHVYAYYRAHAALKQCIDSNVDLMLSTKNESALSICAKQWPVNKEIVTDLLMHMIETEEEDDEEKPPLDFKEQCVI